MHPRVVAQHSAAQQRHGRRQRLGVVGALADDLALGFVAGTADQQPVAPGDDLPRGHLVAGQRAGLVGADDRSRAERLDCRQLADHRVAPGHAADPDRERDGDHRRQTFGDRPDRQRDDRDQRLVPGERAREHREGEQQYREDEDRRGEAVREAFDLAQQRSGHGLDRFEQRADPADLGTPAGGDDDPGRLARGHQRARERHVAPVAERGVGGHVSLGLLRRDRFAGQRRFVDQHPARANEPYVRRQAVSGLEQHHVAEHQLPHRELPALAGAQDDGVRRDHAGDRRERLLGLALLHEADGRVGDDHHENDRGVDRVPEQHGRERAAEQEIDQRAVKLPEEPHHGMDPPRRRERIRPMLGEPPRGLLVGQTLGRGRELREHLFDRDRVPGDGRCGFGCLGQGSWPLCLRTVNDGGAAAASIAVGVSRMTVRRACCQSRRCGDASFGKVARCAGNRRHRCRLGRARRLRPPGGPPPRAIRGRGAGLPRSRGRTSRRRRRRGTMPLPRAPKPRPG